MTELHREPLVETLDKETDEYCKMQESIAFYKPRQEVIDFIMDAYNAHDWDWRNSDGCTGVSEAHFPKGYRWPPCVGHDYTCWQSRRAKSKKQADAIRREGDRKFLMAMKDYGRPSMAKWRWAGVRLAYWAWYRWFIKGDGKSRCGGC